jgi:hypothetical protein
LVLSLSTTWANPAGGVINHGSATMNQNGNVLTINQGTDRLIMGCERTRDLEPV